MSITPQFTKEDIQRRFDNFAKRIEEESIRILQELGVKCVKEALDNRGYTDQTGALNSSTGYIVFKNGEAVVTGNFRTVIGLRQEKAKKIEDGATKGQELAEKVGKANSTGLVLVVVAGMNYALFVEAKGFNVLSSAEHLAEQELPRMIAELKEDIKNA